MSSTEQIHENTPEHASQDFEYISRLLNTLSRNMEDKNLGGVNFSFAPSSDGALRISGAQIWFSEKKSDK